MKLPNGFGGITKLPGNRRKPYQARITQGWIYDKERDKMVQNRVTLGTYKTKKEALQALAEYAQNPYDISDKALTMQELYDRWFAQYFANDGSDDAYQRSMKSAWRHCHMIHSMKVRDVRARHLKGAIDDGYIIQDRGKHKGEISKASPNTKTRIKSMFNLIFDYALEYELVDKNYARTFDLSDEIMQAKEDQRRGHIIFSQKEMDTLWANVDSCKFADWLLIQCYMGWRPQELAILKLSEVNLENRSITGGMKTPAGKQRVVPIHPRIFPLVERNYRFAESLGSSRLLNDPEATKGGMTISYDKYARRFDKVIEVLKLNPEHRPHDPRMHFITAAKKNHVDTFVIKRLVGHKITDITEGVYTQRNLEWDHEEIKKIP